MKTNNARRLIAAVARPRWLVLIGRHPQQLIHQRLILSVGIRRTILEAQQVNRRLFALAARGVVGDKAFTSPAYPQQIGSIFNDIAQRVDYRVLGIGADLQQQIAVALGGIKRIVGKARHGLQLFRLQRLQAKTFVKQRYAHRNRNGQVIRRDLRAQNTGIHRRQFWIGNRRRRTACGQKGDARGQQLKQPYQFIFVTGQHVEGDQHHRGLLRRGDARLMLPVERLYLLSRIGRNRSGRETVGCGMKWTTAAQGGHAAEQTQTF